MTLVLLSILASVAMPYAEITVRRTKEVELHRALREVRAAIDDFHHDWEEGLIPPLSRIASKDGFPTRLDVLTDGVRLTDGRIHKYLRRVPYDPFADSRLPASEQWRLIGYRDKSDSSNWNQEDIYDIRTRSTQQGIDKSFYHDW